VIAMTRLALTILILLVVPLAGAPPALAAWSWPLPGEVITPYRNGSDPYAGGQHRGIDIAGGVGDPVRAAEGGIVSFAGTAGSSGLTLTVRTADGRFDTSYLHLSAIGVREGDQVAAGDRLGAVGVSGRRSAERPHLHFGVREAGTRHAYRDPLSLLPARPAAPAPEPPPAAPVTAPAPVAPRPAPAPARRPEPGRRPAPVRRPAPQPRPRGVPVPRTAPRPGTIPRRVPASGVRRAPADRPAAEPLEAPARQPSPAHARRGSPDRAGRPAAGPRTALAPSRDAPGSTAPAPARPESATPDGGGGSRLAWALAVLGLVAAAAFAGTDHGRDAARRGGATVRDARIWLASRLRPLLGRQ
jgi:peptidase M23-like protein